MGKTKAAVLLYGPQLHHLDHLAILSIILEIPLIVTEEEITEIAERYYPYLDIHFYDYKSCAGEIVQRYDILFSCLPKDLFDDIFLFSQNLYQKSIQNIWCPHGNSDKGRGSFFMEALRKEKMLLVYGQQMIDFMEEKQVLQGKNYITIDNYRHQFYQREKVFFDRIVQKEVLSQINPRMPTILYAPTWQDKEQSSSFFSAAPTILKNLPDSYNLIVKIHPNLFSQDLIAVEKFIHSCENKQNVLFLKDFPLIYPLLEICSIYLGDMSSVGYDFLTFNRPMYFLNEHRRDAKTDTRVFLYRCGVSIFPENYDKVYEIMEHTMETDSFDFAETRKQVYEYAFEPHVSLEEIARKITMTYTKM